MEKLKLLFCRGCRSDVFTDPIIKALEADPFFKVFRQHLHTAGNAPEMFQESFNIINHFCHSTPVDLAIITGDRIEMAGACNALFLNNIPIAHLGAGIVGDFATFDGTLRHNITLMADIALCEDEFSCEIVYKLWKLFNKVDFNFHYSYNKNNIFEVGNPYLEFGEIDESLVPNEPYDLVLLNKTTRIMDSWIIKFPNKKTIRIGSNPDGQGYGSPDVKLRKDFIDYQNLPRSQFLGLLKNCTIYYTNSSSAYYEAIPLGLRPEQIVIMGKRNSERSTPKDWSHQDYKTSDKIIEILKNYWRNKNE